MKKIVFVLFVVLSLAALLAGCGVTNVEKPAETTQPAPVIEETAAPTVAATEAAPADTEEDIVYEGDASSHYIDVVYTEQIARYHTALVEQWNEGQYFENGMSALPYYYYDGNPMDNVGFGFVDLDNDGRWELIIGAIANAEQDPSVFEIWTLVNEEPVMLVQGATRNRYVLEYVEEDGMWYIVNEASNSAFSHATYYLMLNEGKLEVTQGVVFDASVNEQNPWFLTYDLDWDVSNDTPVDEATANSILESNRSHYTALEYFPYIYF